jgi:selenide,water dikinase
MVSLIRPQTLSPNAHTRTSAPRKHPPASDLATAAHRVELRLTQLSSCAGCAAKLSQTLLADVLARLPRIGHQNGNANVLVGSDTFDDAGVYRLNRSTALVQTVDFFTPIVDDPFDFGQIAATNAISDVYAMGGRPITALNLLGIPADKVGPDTIASILRGGAAKVKQAHCTLIGGHTIRAPEPIYGLSVTGIVHPNRVLTNSKARPGDLLILTKPLGTGIATTAIKRRLASLMLQSQVVKVMKQLNSAGATLAEARLVQAATDVTGFGLIGHLGNIVRASGVGAEIIAGEVPVISDEIHALIERECVPGGTHSNLAAADAIVDWGKTVKSNRILLCDAQTSGGLLLCVPPARVKAVRDALRQSRAMACAVIGRIFRAKTPQILVKP